MIYFYLDPNFLYSKKYNYHFKVQNRFFWLIEIKSKNLSTRTQIYSSFLSLGTVVQIKIQKLAVKFTYFKFLKIVFRHKIYIKCLASIFLN
jgi:hypothetical protein